MNRSLIACSQATPISGVNWFALCITLLCWAISLPPNRCKYRAFRRCSNSIAWANETGRDSRLSDYLTNSCLASECVRMCDYRDHPVAYWWNSLCWSLCSCSPLWTLSVALHICPTDAHRRTRWSLWDCCDTCSNGTSMPVYPDCSQSLLLPKGSNTGRNTCCSCCSSLRCVRFGDELRPHLSSTSLYCHNSSSVCTKSKQSKWWWLLRGEIWNQRW